MGAARGDLPRLTHVSGTLPRVGKRILLHCMAFGQGGQAVQLTRHGFPCVLTHSRTYAVYTSRPSRFRCAGWRQSPRRWLLLAAPLRAHAIWMGELEDAWASARLYLSNRRVASSLDAIEPAADGRRIIARQSPKHRGHGWWWAWGGLCLIGLGQAVSLRFMCNGRGAGKQGARVPAAPLLL